MLAHKRNSAKAGRRQLQALVRLALIDAARHRAHPVPADARGQLGAQSAAKEVPCLERGSDHRLNLRARCLGCRPASNSPAPQPKKLPYVVRSLTDRA